MSYWRKRCGKKGLRATDCVSDDTSASVNREKGAWIREYIGTEMAEEEGFEPSSPGAPVKRFSRPPHSTTLPPLRRGDAPQKGRHIKASLEEARGISLAERWGFEPQIPFWGIHDFQSCSFGQLGHLSA